MKVLLLFLLSTTTPHVQLPEEVEAFVVDREACDHFRGGPTEGDSPEQVERRAFVIEALRSIAPAQIAGWPLSRRVTLTTRTLCRL